MPIACERPGALVRLGCASARQYATITTPRPPSPRPPPPRHHRRSPADAARNTHRPPPTPPPPAPPAAWVGAIPIPPPPPPPCSAFWLPRCLHGSSRVPAFITGVAASCRQQTEQRGLASLARVGTHVSRPRRCVIPNALWLTPAIVSLTSTPPKGLAFES